MAIAVIFTPKSMNAGQYDALIKGLDEAGAGAPEGRLYHLCFGTGDQLRVIDVWESGETLERFGQTLMPIAQQAGVDTGQPEVSPVHNTIQG
jgi:hypothetical protein